MADHSDSEETKLLKHERNDTGQTVVNYKVGDDEQIHHVAQRRHFFTMFVIIVLCKGGQGMCDVTLKQFIYNWCQDNVISSSDFTTIRNETNSSDVCGKIETRALEDAAQKMASNWEQYFNILYSVLVFLCISIYGTLSDYTGRKFFLCLAIFGLAIKCGIISITIYFNLHIAWLFLSYGVDALCGSEYGLSLFAFASSADMTRQPSARIFSMAVMEMFEGFGVLTTQFANGYFIHGYGYLYPMVTAGGLCLLSALICLILIRETLQVDENYQVARKRALPTCSTLFYNYVNFYVSSGSKIDKKAFWVCLVAFVILEIATQGQYNTITLFQLGSPFCWSSELIGWYTASSMFATDIIGCLVLKPLQMCFNSTTIACIGILSALADNITVGLATSSSWIFISVGISTLSHLPKSILRGLASSIAPSISQGAMFAGLESSELVSKLIAVPGSLAIYSNTLDTARGFVFFILAGIYAFSIVLMICLTRLLKKQSMERNVAAIQSK